MEIDTTNYQMVAVKGDKICVLRPKVEMTQREALVHAAWLVALCDIGEEFPDILSAVRNT